MEIFNQRARAKMEEAIINGSRKKNVFLSYVLLMIEVLSIFAATYILFDIDKPKEYSWLFLLPLTFCFILLAFSNLFEQLFENLGLLVLVGLFACRMLISPLLLAVGGYEVTIIKNIEQNTSAAIFLIVYEAIIVFAALFFYNKKQELKKLRMTIVSCKKQEQDRRSLKKFSALLIGVLIVYFLCIRIVPEVFTAWRTVFHIGDETFSHFEDSHLDVYGTTFLRKLAVVIGCYLIRSINLIFPAFLILLLSRKKNKVRLIVSLCLCSYPLFFIGGAIGMSLIYVLILLIFVNYIYRLKHLKRNLVVLFVLGAISIVAFWVLRTGGNNLAKEFSRRFSAYFSGVNVVSGVFNLPNGASYKLQYFVRDFLQSIPFSGTIFRLNDQTVAHFFNFYNGTIGQIPATIGMGYYYFGIAFSPLYSILFAFLAFRAGRKINQNWEHRPLKYILYLYLIIYANMGIVMYNVEITLSNLITIWFPIYMLEWLAYSSTADKYLKKIKERIKREKK